MKATTIWICVSINEPFQYYITLEGGEGLRFDISIGRSEFRELLKISKFDHGFRSESKYVKPSFFKVFNLMP